MILWLRLFVVTLALALPLAVHGTAAQDDSFLKVAQDPAVGSFLTDAEGNALYLFTSDTTPDESTCYDDCATAWPPLAPIGRDEPAGWCSGRADHLRAHRWHAAGGVQRHPALLLRR